MVNVHLVDGTFELFRCFHGAPRHTNTQGEEVLAALAWHGLDDGRLRRVVTRTGADDLWPRIERWRG